MARIAVVPILFLIAGVGLGRYSNRPGTATDKGSTKLESLQAIADTDLADYYRLQSLEERYKKADEILGKMVQIFLADLGLRISPSVVTASAAPPLQLETRVDCPPTTAAAIPSAADASAGAATVATNVPPPSAEVVAATLASRPTLDNLRTDAEIAEFLKQSEIRDFEAALKSSTGYANKTSTLPFLNGRFTGTASVIK
ncbi:MAG: hypothetical protein AAB250_19185, partial [Bdellovibrionota bacterium]